MIETRYCGRIDFEYPDGIGADDAINDALFRQNDSMRAQDLDIFCGNACCAPYLTFWHADRDVAERAEIAFQSVLRKHGCKIERYA